MIARAQTSRKGRHVGACADGHRTSARCSARTASQPPFRPGEAAGPTSGTRGLSCPCRKKTTAMRVQADSQRNPHLCRPLYSDRLRGIHAINCTRIDIGTWRLRPSRDRFVVPLRHERRGLALQILTTLGEAAAGPVAAGGRTEGAGVRSTLSWRCWLGCRGGWFSHRPADGSSAECAYCDARGLEQAGLQRQPPNNQSQSARGRGPISTAYDAGDKESSAVLASTPESPALQPKRREHIETAHGSAR